MVEWIRRLSPRAEFLLVNVICFAYPTVSAAVIVALRIRGGDMNNSQVARGILTEVAAGGLALAVLSVRGWKVADLPIHVTARGTCGGFALWMIYLLTWYALCFAFIAAGADLARLEYFHFNVTAAPTVLVLFIIINSVFEELFAAGYIVRALEEHGPHFAISASAAIRSIYHIYQGPLPFLSIFALGLLFAAVYWRWRNLYPLMIAHTMMNLLNLR